MTTAENTIGLLKSKKASAKAAEPEATPDRTLTAVRTLQRETKGTCDLADIADDAGYGGRLRILKALQGTAKVLVKDAEPARLGRKLKTALGAKSAGDLALKCAALLKADLKATLEAAKAAKKAAEAERKQTAPRRIVGGGTPEPAQVKPPSKKKQREDSERFRVQLAERVAEAGGDPELAIIATPRPEAEIEVDLAVMGWLRDPVNGLRLLRLEWPNSQGAICVYNNGSRVAAGVVPPEVLKVLRTETCEDPVVCVQQLLEPADEWVEVTLAARRHLTAVLDALQKQGATIMATKKKFTPPAGVAKKSVKKAEKKESGPRKSSLFRLLSATKKTWEAFTMQKGVLVAAFVKAGAVGSKAAGIARGQLIEALPGVPTPNISFYLSKWQGEGIVEKLPAAE